MLSRTTSVNICLHNASALWERRLPSIYNELPEITMPSRYLLSPPNANPFLEVDFWSTYAELHPPG